jgi:hypothetical protein
MAIVVEEEGRKVNILQIVIWLSVLAVIGIAIYYIFFVSPPTADVVIGLEFKNINPLGNLNINPVEVLGGPPFNTFQSHVTVTQPDPANFGRQNPFADIGEATVNPVEP